MARILVVDDEPEIVRLVRSYLEDDGHSVVTAYDGLEAMSILRRDPPDLLILDLCLPKRDGWDITRTLRNDSHLGALPIIMLTARVEGTDKVVGLELGADDYITKPFDPREMAARVRAVVRRSMPEYRAPAHRLCFGPLTLNVSARRLTVHGRVTPLTPTEFSLCRLFLENPGRTLRRSELGREALRQSATGSGRTLDAHIKNLRRKIEHDPHAPTLIQTVYGIGYRLATPAEP